MSMVLLADNIGSYAGNNEAICRVWNNVDHFLEVPKLEPLLSKP
jgi:hypothetical protein